MRGRFVKAAVAAAAMVGAAASSLPASETDQYTLPRGARFADLGRYFNVVHYRVLETAVERLNQQIDNVRWMSDEQQRDAEVRQFHDPRAVAQAVRYQFAQGFIDTADIERAIASPAAASAFPGELPGYKRGDWIYFFAHLPIDPRNFPLLWQSSTIKLYGSYMGTDKIAHFHDLGHIYYQSLMAARGLGLSEERALALVVDQYSNGMVSEGAFIGFLASGVFSNGDLASNYVGMKFYQNLTEPVVLKGVERPPMLVLVGDHWRLNHHVRPESDFFEAFVSDHFNEALNPNVFEWGLRHSVRRRIQRDAADIVAFYAEGDGRPRCAVYFDNLARELSTYYGENYGARGEVGTTLLSIGHTCIGSLDGVELASAPAPAEPASTAAALPAWVSGVSLGGGRAADGGWVRGRRLHGPETEVAAANLTVVGGRGRVAVGQAADGLRGGALEMETLGENDRSSIAQEDRRSGGGGGGGG